MLMEDPWENTECHYVNARTVGHRHYIINTHHQVICRNFSDYQV